MRRTEALLRIELADGRRVQTVLRAAEPFFTVPGRSGALDVAGSYAVLGFEHILSGLDHPLPGLGFAGVLTQVGLPTGEIPLALFSFNVGVELAQVLFVAGIVVVRAALSAMVIPWHRATVQIPAYAIGSFAAFWVLERVSVFL